MMPGQKIKTVEESIADAELRIDVAYHIIDAAKRDVDKACESLKAAQEFYFVLMGERPRVCSDIFDKFAEKQKELLQSMREGVDTFSSAVSAARASRTPCEPLPM